MPEFGGETHPGCHRENNEDAIGWAMAAGVWLVADGMGGYASGEVASRIVKDTVLKEATEPEFSLGAALLRAHRAIIASGAEQPDRKGMGSTAVVVQVTNQSCRYAWCGDSRLYLWRAERLERLTRDHSRLQGMIDAGEITSDQARGHPEQNQLTQALGMGEPRPDEGQLQLRSGDWLLLCSDGLHDTVPDNEIAQLLRARGSPGASAHTLIQRALELDARDNVSVIAIQCPEYSVERVALVGSSRLWWIIALAIAGAMALGLVLRATMMATGP